MKYLSLIFFFLSACSASKLPEKTADFYLENSEKIECLSQEFENLNQKQTLALGFTDRKFENYALQIHTDTVRYIYNSKLNDTQVFSEMIKTPISQGEIQSLLGKMKDLKCLWLDKHTFYTNGNAFNETWMSFGLAENDNLKKEGKFYVLMLLAQPLPEKDLPKFQRIYDFQKIKDGVYFSVRERYR